MKLSDPEISTCPTCGTSLEKTSSGDLGCMVCLLRAGLSDESQIAEDLLVDTDNQFGVYIIERQEDGSLHELGRGAMGVTYRAIDASLQRKVALKIIKTDRAARGAEARERFMREARTAATLRHPNVATVYQFGIREESGQCFYAMELIEGETLEQRVRRTGPLNPATAVAIAQQVTAALVTAEKHGLVHRDLKPANLMLVSPETTNNHGEEEKLIVKVIDFGLAKAVKSETDPMSLTRNGFVGTPSFASPEQFGNAPIDVRSDVYSLGVTLWFALTGKTPFTGRSVEEIRNAQQSSALSTEPLKAARVPLRLIALLKSMLAVEPAARPGTTTLAARLTDCAASTNSVRRRLVYAVSAALILVLTTVWFVSRPTLTHEVGGTSNSAAHEAYLKGLYIWNSRHGERYPEAEQYFRQAIALDANYAEAYAGLSNLVQFRADHPLQRAKRFAEATMLARRALELNPNLPEAHAALGLIAMNYEWDWAEAEREFRRAIELNPDYATGHHWLAEYLGTQRRFDESLREIKRARELNPTLPVIYYDIGKLLFFAGRFREAEAELKEGNSLDPSNGSASFWLPQIYAKSGRFPEALAAAAELEQVSGNVWSSGIGAYVNGLAGDVARAQQLLAETKSRMTTEDDELPLVYAYVGVGDIDQAFVHLIHDCETRSTTMTSLRTAPVYDSLRSDPRFLDLLHRVHLAP